MAVWMSSGRDIFQAYSPRTDLCALGALGNEASPYGLYPIGKIFLRWVVVLTNHGNLLQ